MATIHGSKKKPLSPSEMLERIPSGGVRLTRSNLDNVYLAQSRQDYNVSCWVDTSSMVLPLDNGNFVSEEEYHAAFQRMEELLRGDTELFLEAERFWYGMVVDNKATHSERRMIIAQNAFNEHYGLPAEELPRVGRSF